MQQVAQIQYKISDNGASVDGEDGSGAEEDDAEQDDSDGDVNISDDGNDSMLNGNSNFRKV